MESNCKSAYNRNYVHFDSFSLAIEGTKWIEQIYTHARRQTHTHTQTQWLKAIQQQQMWRLKNYRHIANTNNPFFIFVFEQTMQL